MNEANMVAVLQRRAGNAIIASQTPTGNGLQ